MNSSPPTTPTAVIAVCGGIAAYKVVDLASRLAKVGLSVHVLMSEAAQQFVQPLSFSAVTGRRTITTLFPDSAKEEGEDLYPHLYPSTRADLFILAPATANAIAKIAQGLGDDLISTAALSLPPACRRYVCPAMNVEMWESETNQAHIRTMEERGWIRLGPERGLLACGAEGEGRLSEPADVASCVLNDLASTSALSGRRVLILSGPTHEHLDPVRFLGNGSSGRMGKALAEAAAAAGACVDFVSGPVEERNLPRRERIALHRVVSADDMLRAADALYDAADLVVFAAAVADYAPVHRCTVKGPKRAESFSLELRPTPDIAATLNRRKRTGQVAVGFALQTGDGAEEARAKLQRKAFDLILLNHLDALGGDSGRYALLKAHHPGGAFEEWGALGKATCARRILSAACPLLKARQNLPTKETNNA